MAKFKKKTEYADQAVAVETPEVPTRELTDDDLLSHDPIDLESVRTEAKVMNAAAAAIPAGGVMMDAAAIAAIVQAAVAGAQQAGNTGIAEQIAAGVSKALTGHMGPRQKTVAEIGEVKTPFNPTGKKRDMEAEFFQNGFPINARMVSDGEIEMLHQLVPGTYGPPDFPITVVKKVRTSGGLPRIHVIYGGSKDDRMREKNYASSFYGLLSNLVKEAKEQKTARRAALRAELESTE